MSLFRQSVMILGASIAAFCTQVLMIALTIFVYDLVSPTAGPISAKAISPIGRFLEPIAGISSTLLAAFLVARQKPNPIITGLMVGLGSAMVDGIVGVLMFSRPFLLSDLNVSTCRVLSGLIGGWLACDKMVVVKMVKINATREQVWRCLTELELLKQWITQLVDEELIDQHTSGIGTRSTLIMQEAGKLIRYDSVVTDYQDHARLRVKLSGGSLPGGADMILDYQLASAEATTELTYQAQLALPGLFRLMLPIIYLASYANLRRDLDRLAKLAPTVSIE